MTSRERMVAASRGGEVDQKPVISWPHPRETSDALIYPLDFVPADMSDVREKITLVEVLNPFGLALQRNVDLNAMLTTDPEIGNGVLNELVADVKENAQRALGMGADGILYRVHGARARHCTPMQYGGYYFERDREILSELADTTFNMVFVVGDDDAFLDFVSDLPAQAFGWDSQSSGVSATELRQMRPGALVSADPDADILLQPGTADLSTVLESSVRTENLT